MVANKKGKSRELNGRLDEMAAEEDGHVTHL